MNNQKKPMETIARKLGLLAVSVALLSGAGSVRADVVYNNTVNDLQLRFAAQNGVQIGDQITLADSSRRLTNFVTEYYLTNTLGGNVSGNEFARIRLYENNGPLFNGFASPGATPLFDTGPIAIPSTMRSTVGWSWAVSDNVNVPDNFTWTIEFTGIEANENVGLDLYGPVSVGSSFGDYWQLNGANWVLLQNTNTPPVGINFAALAQATVPEPSSMALLALGGIVGAFFWNRRRLG
jgi:hypothetical protein